MENNNRGNYNNSRNNYYNTNNYEEPKAKESEQTDEEDTSTFPTKRVLIGFLLFFILLTGLLSFKIIPTGYTGVKITFGQINEQVVPKGFNFKIPYVQKIKKVNNKLQDIVFADEGEKSRIWAESTERTPVYAEKVTVSYKINPNYSAWIFSNVSGGVKNIIDLPLTSSALKSATKQLTAGDATNRAKIEPLAKKMLQDSLDTKYGKDVVIVQTVIINQMDFEQGYLDSIAAKSAAQLAYEQNQINNKKIVEAEQAKADQKEIQAKIDAEIKRIDTDAEVYAISEKAKAQAEANRLISSSLTSQVLYSEWVKNWDGKLPQVAGSDAGIIIKDLTGQTP